MTTLWVIEDEEELLLLYKYSLKDLNCTSYQLVNHVDKCHAEAGDVVIHDLIGVGRLNKKEGITYYIHSGSINPNDHVDYRKPCDVDAMFSEIIARHNI